jgi:predicted anti-sigma-YlaC factor YlaD
MRHISDEEMFRLVDGECSAEEQTYFQTHMQECAACKALYTEIASLDTQLQQMILESPSADFTEKLMDKWQAAPHVDQSFFFNRSYSRITTWMAFGFGLILILLSGTSLGLFNNLLSFTQPDSQVKYDLTGLQSLLQNELLLTVFMIVNAVLVLLIVDKTVLQPYFRKRFNQI